MVLHIEQLPFELLTALSHSTSEGSTTQLLGSKGLLLPPPPGSGSGEIVEHLPSEATEEELATLAEAAYIAAGAEGLLPMGELQMHLARRMQSTSRDPMAHLKKATEVFQALSNNGPDDKAIAWYNMACVAAMANRPDYAAKALRRLACNNSFIHHAPVTLLALELDQEWRKLAYAYGRKLLPRMGTFESLYYALDLNSDSCHMDMEAVATPASDPQPSDLQPRDWRDTAVFVDVNGDDSQVGSENHPVRSLQVACDLAITRGAEIPMVVLRGGTHFLMKTLMLGPQHSKLLITSYPNEHAEVSGGKKLQVTWRPYNLTGGANIWVSDVPGQVQEVVALHVDGVRATRARYPNMPQGVEVTCGYGCTIDGSKQTWIRPDFTKFGNSSNYTDTTPQHFRNTTVWDWFKRYEIGVSETLGKILVHLHHGYGVVVTPG
eukprot:g17583.t1